MYRAVIVDDEDVIVQGLSKILPWEKYNCRVVATAGDGKRALELIRTLEPDMLITDIRMPGMDGLALIAALRSEFPAMQVTILSGYPDFEYAQRAMQLGVARYCVKPSKLNDLEEALAEMVRRLEKTAAEAAQPAAGAQAGESAETPAPESEGAQNFIIKNALQYIEEHYAEKLTLTDVAESVYVSQWHLSKLIGKYTSQSFSELLNGVRIAKAKELLQDPSLRIWEISERVGFTDVTHFSRIFKKMENRSANEYRNQVLGGGGR